ncbi:MAG: glycosyltransferase [Geminicoccaceae bacterium]|jgi:glycosyltransferase involved in cell wall biosynthesis|nr:glycosyltransferase [Geminicoccaceae bacterium]
MRLEPAPQGLDILFIYSRPPLPMTRGDELTVAHLLEFLAARGHRVDFVTLLARGEKLRPEHRQWLEARCRSVRLIEHGKLAALWQGVGGWLRGWPFQIGYLHVPEQLRVVREMAAGRHYDLAYAYYIRSAEALRGLEGLAPVRFLALQLSQTLNTERLARNAVRWWERLFYRIESRRMAAYESRIWQGADRTVLIGAKDVEAIEAACRQQGQPLIDNVVLGPHGVDTERFRPRPEAEEVDTVVMSGVMRYAPNVEAALWFLTEVWPTIRAARPAARFFLVGRDPTAALLAYDGRDAVTVTGTVDEPAEWIARGAVCVAPIRAAAGLQNKLLEALAMGKAVVATPEANEGIQAPAGEALLLAREPASFAAAVLELLKDAARRQALSRAGRAFVETKWTWEAPFLTLEAAFLEAAHGTIKGHQAERRSSMISA